MVWCSCGITFLPNLSSPYRRKYSCFKKPIVHLGLNLESESKVHQELFWTPKFIWPGPLMWYNAWVLTCLQELRCFNVRILRGPGALSVLWVLRFFENSIQQCNIVMHLYMRIHLWNLWLIRGLCAPCPINVDITCACGQTIIQVLVKPYSCRLLLNVNDVIFLAQM